MLFFGEFKVKHCELTDSWDVYFESRLGVRSLVISDKSQERARAIAEHFNQVITGKIRPDRRRKN